MSAFDDLQASAIHESAHAVMYHLFGFPLTSVRADDDGTGLTCGLKPKWLNRRSRLLIDLAGIAAERVAGLDDPPMDEYHAAVAKYGRELVDQMLADAEAIVRADWKRVTRIAKTLLQHRSLHGAVVRGLCEVRR